MSAIAGRARRQVGATVSTTFRLSPKVRERMHRGAQARGVSLNRYIETLIQADEQAGPVEESDEQERLPLSA